METHITSKLGTMSLQKITVSDVQRCFNALMKKPLESQKPQKPEKLSPSSVKQLKSIVQQCFAQAVRNRLIGFSPANDIQIPKMEAKTERSAFVGTELQRIIAAAQVVPEYHGPQYYNPAFYPALMVLIETGARRGEVLGLTWDRIDTKNDTVRIRDTIVQVDGKAVEKPNPKNTSSIRTVPISKGTIALLETLRKPGDTYVFHTRTGKPLAPRNFNRKFKEWCDAAGITHTPHELRHTLITDMIVNDIIKVYHCNSY